MSVINLDSQVVKTIGSEIATLDTTLLQSYFPELESELSTIASNVKGEELHAILNTLNSQFSSVKAELSIALPKLENFLEEQVTSYTQTEEELDGELSSVLSKMGSIAGTTIVSTNNGDIVVKAEENQSQNADNNTELSPEMEAINKRLEELEKQNAELVAQNKELSKSHLEKANDEFLREAGADNKEFGERFTSDWSNVGEAYQDGLLSGVANTLGATWNTTANGVGWAWNQAVNCAEWALGAVGLGKGTLGDLAGWLIS